MRSDEDKIWRTRNEKMKIKEIRDLPEDLLVQKLKEVQRELNIERGGTAAAGGRATNPGKIRNLRRTIARIKTILSQKRKGIIK